MDGRRLGGRDRQKPLTCSRSTTPHPQEQNTLLVALLGLFCINQTET